MRKLILEAPYQLKMITDAPIPEPGENQVRVHVKKIGICGSDPTIYKGLHPYVTYPRVMGHEIGAVIDKVGANVPASRVGERVAIIPHIVCGHCDACKNEIYNFCEELKCTGAEADGAHCDYFCIDACMAIPVPEGATLEQAAMVEPACVAYHGAKRGHIQKGETVLVIGAGPIGLFCMQSCFALGAGKVSGIRITKNNCCILYNSVDEGLAVGTLDSDLVTCASTVASAETGVVRDSASAGLTLRTKEGETLQYAINIRPSIVSVIDTETSLTWSARSLIPTYLVNIIRSI